MEYINRNTSTDIARVIAFVTIVFLHHLPSYLFNFYDLRLFGIPLDLSFIGHLNRYYGLGLFVFISGSLLTVRNDGKKGFSSAMCFYKKRFIRIFPLYWLSLILFLTMFFIYPGKEITFENIAAHILGLQLFLAEPIPTIWYIGLIVSYYAFYSIQFFINNKKYNYLLYLGFFLLLILAKLVFTQIDNRLIIYWPIFVIGSYFKKINWINTKKLLIILLLSTVICSCLFLSINFPLETGVLSMTFIADVFLVTFMMVSFTLLIYNTINFFKPHKIALMSFLSSASFCAYLFHTPVFQITHVITRSFDNLFLKTLLFFVASVILLIGSYYMQKNYDRLCQQKLRIK